MAALQDAMDVDHPPIHTTPSDPAAGPSSSSATSTDLPLLFFMPPGPPQPQTHLRSTDDLLARFQLLPSYDKYVRPHIAAPDDTLGPNPPSPGRLDKGKGKEKDVPATPVTPAAPTPGADDGEDDDGTKGDGKKKKNNYKHLIKGVPGKHSLKKDTYLMTVMQAPPKQRMAITEFDKKSYQDAFAVSLEGLKGWNINALVAESAQAREDRKKRKELKRLAKVQSQSVPPTPTTSTAPGLAHTPIPSGSGSTPRPGTPKVQQQRPPSIQTHSIASSSGNAGIPRPLSSLPSASASTVHPHLPQASSSTPPAIRPAPTPITTSTSGGSRPTQSAAPIRTTPTSTMSTSLSNDPFVVKRGKKREREDTGPPGTPVASQASGAGGGTGQMISSTVAMNGVVNSKAGVPGARPRPVKKQRMDAHGQARDIPVQQPTPQGV